MFEITTLRSSTEVVKYDWHGNLKRLSNLRELPQGNDQKFNLEEIYKYM